MLATVSSNLSKDHAAELLATFPTVVGPVTGAVVGVVAAGAAGAVDEWLEDRIKMGPVKPSGLLAIAAGAVALVVDSPDVSALLSNVALGMSAPAIYEASRGGIRRARAKDAQKRAAGPQAVPQAA